MQKFDKLIGYDVDKLKSKDGIDVLSFMAIADSYEEKHLKGLYRETLDDVRLAALQGKYELYIEDNFLARKVHEILTDKEIEYLITHMIADGFVVFVERESDGCIARSKFWSKFLGGVEDLSKRTYPYRTLCFSWKKEEIIDAAREARKEGEN